MGWSPSWPNKLNLAVSHCVHISLACPLRVSSTIVVVALPYLPNATLEIFAFD